MASRKATDRTPTETTDNVSRRPGRPKQTPMYHKQVILDLYGSNPAELQQVAKEIHTAGNAHALCIGGKTKRKVSVSKGASYVPKKIFDGVV